MTFFRVNRVWRDNHSRVYSEFKDLPSFGDAKHYANALTRKEGEVWIEQRQPGRFPINTDPRGAVDPMTPEHLEELRSQIRSFGAKTKLLQEAT